MTALSIGDPIPDVSLKDIEGREVHLTEFCDRPALIYFWSAECPWVERADLDVLALLDRITPIPVAANANEPPDMLRAVAAERGLPILLLDPDQQFADRCGASITPKFMIGVVVDLAVVAIVGEDLGVVDGLRRSWDVCRAHAGEVIVMAIILGIINAVLGFLIALPVIVIMVPVVVGMMSQAQGFMQGGIVITVVLFLLYLPVLIALSGILKSYIDSAWTVSFRRLTGRIAGTSAGASIYNAPVAEI